MGDKLILRGLKFHGFHGVKPEEKSLGQKFLVDVDAWMDLRMAGKSDLLSDTVSYTDIYRKGSCGREISGSSRVSGSINCISNLEEASSDICCSCESGEASCCCSWSS
ncbi:Dihydroneopterin aldolase isoform 2 [Theobroma cacao]|uniref:dihydroneopterin aldolase n=1 Tax=Theobroma cacao TaxID=3641 RepID=A0A061EV37_THECC|nr:Dihydroneopterin aldolase isoform 2 [Theobroma cacao]